MRLENYVVCSDGGAALFLMGNVYDDPRGRPDGSLITTSYIVEVANNKVTTHSGSVYHLGQPDPDYLEGPEGPIFLKYKDGSWEFSLIKKADAINGI